MSTERRDGLIVAYMTAPTAITSYWRRCLGVGLLFRWPKTVIGRHCKVVIYGNVAHINYSDCHWERRVVRLFVPVRNSSWRRTASCVPSHAYWKSPVEFNIIDSQQFCIVLWIVIPTDLRTRACILYIIDTGRFAIHRVAYSVDYFTLYFLI